MAQDNRLLPRTTEQLTTNGTLYFQGYEKEEPSEGWSNYTVIVDVILTVGLGLISRYHSMKKLKKINNISNHNPNKTKPSIQYKN